MFYISWFAGAAEGNFLDWQSMHSETVFWHFGKQKLKLFKSLSVFFIEHFLIQTEQLILLDGIVFVLLSRVFIFIVDIWELMQNYRHGNFLSYKQTHVGFTRSVVPRFLPTVSNILALSLGNFCTFLVYP